MRDALLDPKPAEMAADARRRATGHRQRWW